MVYGFDSRRRYKTRPLSFHEPKGRVFYAPYNFHNKATNLTPFGKYIKIRRCRTLDMYDNGGFRFMILPSAPLSGFQDNGTVGWDSNKRVVVGFKFNRLRLSAQKVNGRVQTATQRKILESVGRDSHTDMGLNV